MPIFPVVASAMVKPFFNRPFFSASSTIFRATRSFRLPLGFIDSSLARTEAPFFEIFFSFTKGVFPTSSKIFLAVLFSVWFRWETVRFKLLTFIISTFLNDFTGSPRPYKIDTQFCRLLLDLAPRNPRDQLAFHLSRPQPSQVSPFFGLKLRKSSIPFPLFSFLPLFLIPLTRFSPPP